jgi:hypothetical protein
MVATKIQEHLENFQQWSELEPRPETFESHDALLKACELDVDNNKVTTPKEVTNLIAISYVASAQIYLHSRTFRYFDLPICLDRPLIHFADDRGSIH